MPVSYTCHCGLYVHPSVRKASDIHIHDCTYAPTMKTFPAYEIVMPKEQRLALWYVQGISGYWPIKIVAEAMAREYFPDEDCDIRYARIGYQAFNLEE